MTKRSLLSRREFAKGAVTASLGWSTISKALALSGKDTNSIKDDMRIVLNPTAEPRTPGKFKATVDSLRQYKTPDWYDKAKFGIWSCWNAYTVPGVGDWYARNMYIQGHPHYEYHVSHYGHPSKVGYKDVINLWKGERFNPEEQVDLFKHAGAKYVLAMANHHDNHDLWNSKYHQWNSINHGPKKDIIAMWRHAVLQAGLRFGVTSHLERSWSWFQTNKGSDKIGPLAGVPYDGNDPSYVDLYLPKPEDGDTNMAHPINAPLRWRIEWLNRTLDLIHNYKPDVFYVDGGVPFNGDDKGATGLEMIAELYNANASWHDGDNQAVMFIKDWKGKPWGYYWDGIATLNLEKTHLNEIRKEPWQTETSIGDWTWRRDEKYRSAADIIHELVDVVSKNGNLTLNASPREDGTLDIEATALLKDIGDWMAINGESIYESKPWQIFGVGDLRIVQKKGSLYVTALKLSPGSILNVPFQSDGRSKGVKVERVEILGQPGPLKFAFTDASGLSIHVPEQLAGKHTWVFKVSGRNLAVDES